MRKLIRKRNTPLVKRFLIRKSKTALIETFWQTCMALLNIDHYATKAIQLVFVRK